MNGWDVRPTLDRANANRRPLAQAAGSFVAGSPLPQALIQRRQRLTYELRLSTLVILSRPAPQPAAGDSAVAQPTTTPFTGLVRAPEPVGDMPPRHIPRPTSLRALHCVPSGVVVRAWLPEPCPAATGGSGFRIETGSESAIGINSGSDPPIKCGSGNWTGCQRARSSDHVAQDRSNSTSVSDLS